MHHTDAVMRRKFPWDHAPFSLPARQGQFANELAELICPSPTSPDERQFHTDLGSLDRQALLKEAGQVAQAAEILGPRHPRSWWLRERLHRLELALRGHS
jgi:hypothetical protein